MDPTYLAYARRGAVAWWRYPAALVLGLAFSTVLGMILLAAGEAAHALPTDLIEQMQHPTRPATFFVVTGALFGLQLAGFALAIRWLHHKRFGDIVGAWSWTGYATGFAIWAGMITVMVLVDFAIAPSGFKFTGGAGLARLAALALVSLAVQTFAEEFIFRGYLTQGLVLALKNPWIASLISGLLFGAMHIPNGLPQAASAVVTGVVLSLIAIRTGGLAFGSGLHLANNLFAGLVVVSNDDIFKGMPALFTQDTPQLMWLDTATGSLATILVGVVMLRRRGATGG